MTDEGLFPDTELKNIKIVDDNPAGAGLDNLKLKFK